MIDILTGFSMGSADAIDSRIVLTSNEMKSVDDTVMPDVYFAVNSSDGLLYVYKKGNPINKDTGKFRVVSKNDFNDSYKTKLDSLENYNDTEIRSLISAETTNRENEDTNLSAAINTKVDKEDGKGLSSNDYTNDDKMKLASLENYDDTDITLKINKEIDNRIISDTNISNALDSISAELNLVISELRADMSNKVSKEEGKGLSSNDFTNEYRAKLDGLSGYDDSELRGLINEKADKSHTHNQYATTEFVETSIDELRQLISTIEEQIGNKEE